MTFKKPIGSVSVSGHKFVGCPMPCGVSGVKGRHDHGKQEWACSYLPLVHAQQEGLQRLSEGSPEMLEKRTLPQRSPQGSRNRSDA